MSSISIGQVFALNDQIPLFVELMGVEDINAYYAQIPKVIFDGEDLDEAKENFFERVEKLLSSDQFIAKYLQVNQMSHTLREKSREMFMNDQLKDFNKVIKREAFSIYELAGEASIKNLRSALQKCENLKEIEEKLDQFLLNLLMSAKSNGVYAQFVKILMDKYKEYLKLRSGEGEHTESHADIKFSSC